MFEHFLHHLHLRHRVHDHGAEHPFPSRQAGISLLDHFMIFAAPLAPLLGFSQAAKIWESQDVTNLFAALWFFSLFMNVMWMMYSFVHRAWPLFLNSFLNMLVNGAIVTAIILYS